MLPVLFKIGEITIYTHGVFILLGIAAGIFAASKVTHKFDLDICFLTDNIVYVVLAGVLGARISYFVIYPNQFEDLRQVLFLWQGGLISYGGFFLGGLVFYLLLRLQKQPVGKWFDVMAIGFPVGLFLGRIGDVLSGDFNSDISILSFNFPTPLLEAVLCFMIFASQLFLIKESKKFFNGFFTLILILLYSAGRFIIDFQRTETKIFIDLSLGQLVGLSLFLISIIAFIYMYRKERTLL